METCAEDRAAEAAPESQPVSVTKQQVSLQDTRQGAEAASVSGRAGLAGGKGSFHGVGQSRLPWRGADPSVNVTGKTPFTITNMCMLAKRALGVGKAIFQPTPLKQTCHSTRVMRKP